MSVFRDRKEACIAERVADSTQAVDCTMEEEAGQ